MRDAIDALVNDDEQLVGLLLWADRRAQAANVPDERHSAVRLAYVSLDLARALERERALDLAFALELDLALALELALNRVSDLALNRARSLDLASTRDLAREYGYRLGSDYALLYAWQMATIFVAVRDWDRMIKTAQRYPVFFEEVIDMVEQAGDAEAAQRLHDFALPASDGRQGAWVSFADSLITVMREERDIGHDWQFSDKQWNKLNAYLAANRFLIDCLNLAYVSDRQAILDGLLAPPGGEVTTAD